MRKIWLIARNTYHLRVRSGSFLFITLFMPVIMILFGLVVSIMSREEDSLQRIGFVDQTGRMSAVAEIETKDSTLFLIHFEDIEQAQSAFEDGHIEAILVIPQGYFSGDLVSFYGKESPGSALTNTLERLIRTSLLPGVPERSLDRIEEPAEVIFVEYGTGTEIRSRLGLVTRVATPAIMAALFALAVVFTTGQLGSAVVREKEQRAMEIVITSIRPSELVAGNVLGMSLLVFTQFGIWISGGLIAVLIFTSGGSGLQGIYFPLEAFLWGLLLIPPGFLLFAVLAAGAGVIAGDNQQAQQLAAFVGLLAFVPLWLTPLFIWPSEDAAVIALTLFPLTAPTVALLRMAFADVPTWQLVASFSSILTSLVIATWFVARIFRAAMLIYGQPLRPTMIWRALRQS